MNKVKQIFKKAIVENPIFALFLGLCPVLAVSNSFDAAFGMSLAVIVVLIMTNMIISAIRKIVPNEIRIPVYIIIIATVVTVVKMLMSAFMATVFNSLGVYLSLIVVNCIILGRAEAFASKNTVLESFFDALSMGFGFLFAICSIALVREFFGTSGLVFTNPFTGKEIFSFVIAEGKYAIGLLTKPSGAFLIFGLLTAAVNAISISKANKQ
jgi:electron transport complex protein RnfE